MKIITKSGNLVITVLKYAPARPIDTHSFVPFYNDPHQSYDENAITSIKNDEFSLLPLLTFHFKYLSCSRKSNNMNHLMLSAFYDNVNKNVGPTLMWVFSILMTIELVYVMVKYLGSGDKK